MRVLHFGRNDQRCVLRWKKRKGKVKVIQSNEQIPTRKESARWGNEAGFFLFFADFFVTPNWTFALGLASEILGGLVFVRSDALGRDFAVFRGD